MMRAGTALRASLRGKLRGFRSPLGENGRIADLGWTELFEAQIHSELSGQMEGLSSLRTFASAAGTKGVKLPSATPSSTKPSSKASPSTPATNNKPQSSASNPQGQVSAASNVSPKAGISQVPGASGGSSGSSGSPKSSGTSLPLIAGVLGVAVLAGGAYYWWENEVARVTPRPVIPNGIKPQEIVLTEKEGEKTMGEAESQSTEEDNHSTSQEKETSLSDEEPVSPTESKEKKTEASVSTSESAKEEPKEGTEEGTKPAWSPTLEDKTDVENKSSPSEPFQQAEPLVSEQAQRSEEALSPSHDEALLGPSEMESSSSLKTITVGEMLLNVMKSAEERQAQRDREILEATVRDMQEKHDAIAFSLEKRISEDEEALRSLKQRSEEKRTELEQRREREIQELQLRQEAALQRKDEESERAIETAKALAEAKSEATMALERANQMEETDKLAYQVAAFKEAFYARSEEAKKSYGAHKLAMCAFLLEEALNTGRPFPHVLPLLHHISDLDGHYGEIDVQDDLVQWVAASLPDRAVANGVPTRQQLLAELWKRKGTLQQLSLVPGDATGVLALALAKVTANVKVVERGTPLDGGGPEAFLGRAESLLIEGQLASAASALLEGCKGMSSEPLAREWAQMALDRAVVEQGLLVLQAHASTVASSLV